MIPKFPEFQPIDYKNASVIRNYAKKHVPYSDHNFTSLYVWDTESGFEVSKLNGNLVYKMQDYISSGKHLNFLSVAGSKDIANTCETLFEFLKQHKDYSPEISLVPQFVASKLKNVGLDNFDVTEDRDSFDYVVRTRDYLELAGKKFETKRRKLNRFMRTYPDIQVIDAKYSDIDARQTLELYASWKEFETEGGKYASNEFTAFNKFLSNSWVVDEANFAIFLYYLREKLCGFSITEIVDGNYGVGHFMKANLNLTDIAEFVMIDTTQRLNKKGVKYYNIEQDLGITGLRVSKLGYKPEKFLKKYTLKQVGSKA